MSSSSENPAALHVNGVEGNRNNNNRSEAHSTMHPNVMHLLQTGAYRVPPVTYMDLFSPLLESFVGNNADAATTADSNNENNNNNSAAHHCSSSEGVAATEKSAAAPPRPADTVAQLRLMRVVVFPQQVSAYFSQTKLLSAYSATSTPVPLLVLPETTNALEQSPEEEQHKMVQKEEEGEKTELTDAQVRISEALMSPSFLLGHLPPFSDDSAYLSAKDVYNLMRQHSLNVTHSGIGSMQTAATKIGLDVLGHIAPCLRLIVSVLHSHIQTRLQHMALEPRVLRVARRLQMTEQEAEALTFLLCCQCGHRLAPNMAKSLTPGVLATYANLSPRAIMHFLGEHRLHMKQGLITSDMRHRHSFMDCTLAIPQEAITALTGDDLSDEQLIKLERTGLAEVLMEERRAAAAAVAAAAAAVLSTPMSPPVEGEGEEEEPSLKRRRTDSPGVRQALLDDDNDGGTSFMEEGCSSSRDASESMPQDMPPSMQKTPAVGPLPDLKMNGSTTTTIDVEASSVVATAAAAARVVPVCEPYTTDVEYMDEAFKLLANLIKIRTAEGDIKDEEDSYVPKSKLEATLRELKGKVRVSSAVHAGRVQATLQARGADGFVPRIEQLSERLHLTELEKMIMLLMVGNVVSHDILIAINGRYVMRDGQRVLTVGYILFVLCDGLKERVNARRAFYQNSKLISNSILSLSLEGSATRSCFNTDLMDYVCDIDRKIVDYLMGTETETAEMVPGSTLYYPTVPMENVVLPAQTTELVLSTIAHYGMFEKCKSSCGFGEGLGNSMSGLVVLFYGPSGTGKTMLANGIAHNLKKRMLNVNVAEFKSDKKAPEMMRFVFREAKLNDAVIFFDECESLFETREVNPLVTSVLSEFERYGGVIIMATNKAQNIDEAMNRRVSLMIEFKLPGHQLREQIWKQHIPKNLKLNEDVDLDKLALNYELTGGLIRNAVLAALNHAVAREKSEAPTLCMADLEDGAKRQLRGFFLASQCPGGPGSASYVTPKRTLAELVVEEHTRKQITAIANFSKGRTTLFSQWGFSEEACDDQGSLYLFSGPSGTGKSLAAEGIAYECGATIRICNIAEVLLTSEVAVHKVFEEGRRLGAIIVFDQAQELFNHSERSVQVSQLIQYHAVRYPKPIIVVVTTQSDSGSAGWVDARASRMMFSQHVLFHLPNTSLRKELWRMAFPEKVPLGADVNFSVLSETAVSAKLIRTVAFSVCCKVALLPVTERTVTMRLVKEELEAVTLRERGRNSTGGMFA